MNRGVSYGGGQSSLGYLFGSGEGKQPRDPPSPSKVTINPPYGIDAEEEEKMPTKPLAKQKTSNSSHQTAQGQNSGKFVTDRPSTKVRSVPGGNSSLGYLFGDK